MKTFFFTCGDQQCMTKIIQLEIIQLEINAFTM
jgi:hypothetical protein